MKLPTKAKQAYADNLADNEPMVMAGLWSEWRNPANGEMVLSCTILTCTPNNTMAELHDRMPCILAEADWSAWLGEVPVDPPDRLALLRPCPNAWCDVWPVDNRVGNVRNKGREIIARIN